MPFEFNLRAPLRHGFVGPPRVWKRFPRTGGLAVSRAFGDTNLSTAAAATAPPLATALLEYTQQLAAVGAVISSLALLARLCAEDWLWAATTHRFCAHRIGVGVSVNSSGGIGGGSGSTSSYRQLELDLNAAAGGTEERGTTAGWG